MTALLLSAIEGSGVSGELSWQACFVSLLAILTSRWSSSCLRRATAEHVLHREGTVSGRA